MDGVLPKEQQEIIEKICIYIVNRYQTTNSCDLISQLIYYIGDEMLGDNFSSCIMTAKGIIELTDEDGKIIKVPHCYNYLFYKDDEFNYKYNPNSIVIIDSAINQFKYINKKIPSYLISNFRDMPELIKYKLIDDDDNINVKFKEEHIKTIANYILNNPKEELKYIEEKDRQDLYSNKNLFI